MQVLTNQEFTYRESPTESDGLAKITDIKGNTLVWNQLQQSASASQTTNGITYTVNSDGSITANGTATATSIFYLPQIGQLYANHKYLVKGCPSGGTAQTYMLTFRCNSFSTVLANEVGNGAIANGQNYNDGNMGIRIVSGVTLSNAKFYPQIFDLTQMGLDISSPSEFTSLFSKPYYDYCQGAMLSFGGRNAKFNQLVQNGNFANTSNWSAGRGTLTASNNVLNIKPVSAWSYLKSSTKYPITNGHKYYLTIQAQKTNANDNLVMAFNTAPSVWADQVTFKFPNDTNWNKFERIMVANANGEIDKIGIDNGSTNEYNVKNAMIIDLTEMFGAGNEPSVEGFKELFPNDYYEYTTGKYMNIGQPVSLKTTGKNLLNPSSTTIDAYINGSGVITASSNDRSVIIPLLSNMSYVFTWNRRTSISPPTYEDTQVGLYNEYPSTGMKGVLAGNTSVSGNNIRFNSGSNKYAVIKIANITRTDFDSTIIASQLEIGSTPTSYEPYTESTLSISLDEFPNGMDGINDARDEKNETGYAKRTAYIKFDGSQAWSTRTTSGGFVLYECIPYNIKNVGTQATAQILNNRYPWNTNLAENKTIRQVNTTISVRRDDITSLQAWYSELASNPLEIVYQLATPLENYGIVDLGTLTYTRVTNKCYQTTDLADLCKWGAQGTRQLNLLCSKFITGTSTGAGTVYGGDEASKTIYFWTNEDEYQSADDFKSAMSGVYLLYEKENPQGLVYLPKSKEEYPFFKSYKGGTEQLLPENGSVPVTAPILADMNYSSGVIEVTTYPNPEQGGETSGDGWYLVGEEATVNALPNEHYAFNNWVLDGEIVSTDPEYTFEVKDE